MSNMSIYNLGPVVNAASQLTAMGVWDELDVHKAIGTPNPHKAMARIKMNKFLNAPELIFAQGIKALVEAGMVGEAAYMLHARGMGGGGGGGGAMMEGSMGMSGQPPSPVGSPVQSVVGDSNAQAGFGPGPGSGPSGPMLPPSDPYGTEP
jgi:hypothetical protein